MNKILNINLGGMPFTIDIDAYANLETYLNTIQSHFSNSEGCEEIILDIEIRMGELFQESMKGSNIISNRELDEVIAIMGTPEDFGAETMTAEDEDSHNHTRHSYTEKQNAKNANRRLYRDGDDKVIAGLCAGISAYFGISDPMWVRLAFVLLVISGISPLLYILLWVIVPTAKTASDKLAMRGENINISNIAKTVEEEISELSKRITEIGKDLSSKKKNNGLAAGSFTPKRNIIVRIIAGVFSLFGKIFHGLIRIIKGVFTLTGSLMVLALGVALVALLIITTVSLPFSSYIGPDSFALSSIGGISIYLTMGIPLFFGLAFVSKFLLGFKMKSGWGKSLGLIWIAAIFVGTMSVVRTIGEYDVRETLSESISTNLQSDIVKINMRDNNHGAVLMNLGDLQLSTNKMMVEDSRIHITESKDHKIHIEKIVSARGKNNKDALKNANTVNSEINVTEDGVITLNKIFSIKRGQKYRGQDIQYNIAIPAGKKIALNKNASRKISRSTFDQTIELPYNKSEYTWEIGEYGMTSTEYIKENSHELNIPVDKIKSLFIEGNFEVDIEHGTTPAIIVVGNKEQVNRVDYDMLNGTVNVKASYQYHKPLKIYVTVNQLSQLNLEDVRSTRMEGIQQENLSIYNSGNGDLYGTLEVTNLNLNLDGNQKIDLMGSGDNLTINSKRSTRLNLEKYLVHNASIKGYLGRNGKINVDKSLVCDKQTLHYIDIMGNPTITEHPTNEQQM